VFTVLWQAHRARGQHSDDVNLMITASTLLDAIKRLPPGRLVAAEVRIAGELYAAWVDLDRGGVLAAIQPPSVYLTGS